MRMAISLFTSVVSSTAVAAAALLLLPAIGLAVLPMPLLADMLRRVPLRNPARGRCSVRSRQLRFIICSARKQQVGSVHAGDGMGRIRTCNAECHDTTLLLCDDLSSSH